MNKVLKKVIQISVSLLFWFVVWAIASFRVNNEFLLPSPLNTLKTVGELISTKEFWILSANTFRRIFLGILYATVIGILLAVITTKLSFADTLVSPAMGAVKATPVASFAFLAVLFISHDFLPVFISALLVVPIVWTNVSAGIRSVSLEHKEVVKIYKIPASKQITKLYVPNVLPYFLAACRSAIGLAWKAGVAAEVLCPPRAAIGTELYYAKTYLETEKLFAVTLLTIIFSIILEKLILVLISKLPIKTAVVSSEVRA